MLEGTAVRYSKFEVQVLLKIMGQIHPSGNAIDFTGPTHNN